MFFVFSMSGSASPLRYPMSWLLVHIQTFAMQQTWGQVRAKPTPHQVLITLTACPAAYSLSSQSPFKPDARKVLQREIPLRRSRHRKCLFSHISDSLSLFFNLVHCLTNNFSQSDRSRTASRDLLHKWVCPGVDFFPLDFQRAKESAPDRDSTLLHQTFRNRCSR